MQRLLNKKLTVVGYEDFSEVKNLCAECGSTSLSKEHGQKMYWRTPQRKARRNTRSVAAGVSLPGSSGASQRVFGYGLQCVHDAPRVHCIEIMLLGKLLR